MAITRQWKRDGVPIDGATGLEYILTEADHGAYISVTETNTAENGSVGVSTSAPVGPITYGVIPVNTVLPEITVA